MPAARSSPIPAATDPDHARPLALRECPGLLERLGMIPDPRDRRVRRHPLASVLAVSAAAVLAGARSVTAVAEWAADAPGPVLAALGVRRDPLTRRCHVPGEATIRRVLAGVDGDAVDATVGAWLADRLHRPGHRRVLAVDGKRLRGSVVTAIRCICWQRRATTTAAWSPSGTCPPPPTRSRCLRRCWPVWTLPVWWSLPTRCTPNATMPVSSSAAVPTTCWSSRPPASPARPAGRVAVAQDPGHGPHP